ncbi:MAG: hypothetical protein EBQ97_00215 [Bacteroidetes bacterium]|nr:hypothetical protein [Bacteroidota bacterium]
MNSVVSEKKFIQERLGIPYENLSQSYLRAETQLSNLSTYNFYVQRGQVANPLVTENLLELNDQFVITHFRISLRWIDPTTTAAPTATEQLNAQQYLYADPTKFTSTSANAASIYNGNLSFIIDRKQFLPAFPVNAFYRVPTTQSNAFLATAGTTGTPAATFTGNTGVNGYDNGLFGFYVSEPTLIDGRQTLDITLNLGASVSIATIGTDPMVYATFETRGYLVVNSKS